MNIQVIPIERLKLRTERNNRGSISEPLKGARERDICLEFNVLTRLKNVILSLEHHVHFLLYR
jgi:hypothetical protein